MGLAENLVSAQPLKHNALSGSSKLCFHTASTNI